MEYGLMGGNSGMGNRKHGKSGTPGNEAIKQQVERFVNKDRADMEKTKKKHKNKTYDSVKDLMSGN